MRPAAEGGVLVGVDFGTSAVKVLAVRLAGRLVASASGRYPLETSPDGSSRTSQPCSTRR